jgi:hypothetical protein
MQSEVWHPENGDHFRRVESAMTDLGGCIQKFPDWVHNEINNNKHTLRSNTKAYGHKTH